jgi:hypothetical protein
MQRTSCLTYHPQENKQNNLQQNSSSLMSQSHTQPFPWITPPGFDESLINLKSLASLAEDHASDPIETNIRAEQYHQQLKLIQSQQSQNKIRPYPLHNRPSRMNRIHSTPIPWNARAHIPTIKTTLWDKPPDILTTDKLLSFQAYKFAAASPHNLLHSINATCHELSKDTYGNT